MASSQHTATALVKSRFLLGLDEGALRRTLNEARVRRIAPKKIVTASGARPDHLFLLREGRAGFYGHTDSGSEVLLLP